MPVSSSGHSLRSVEAWQRPTQERRLAMKDTGITGSQVTEAAQGWRETRMRGKSLHLVGAGGKASTWINFSMSPPKSFWLYWEVGRAWRLFWNFLCEYWAL